MQNWKFFLFALVVFLLSACTNLHQDRSAEPLTILTIGTADSGGTMYPVGSAIADTITEQHGSIKVNISASTGSTMNVEALSSGEIDLGLVSGDVAYAALHGTDEFTKPVETLRAIAAVYPSVSNWMAPKSLNITFVHQLTNATVGVGPQESTTELSARVALDTLHLEQQGVIPVNCSLGLGAENVKNGSLAAVHGFSGVPIQSLNSLSEQLPCQLLTYTQQELDQILRENPFYYATTIPSNTYTGQTATVSTFGVKCLLCVDASMPDELAYQIAKTLWESRDELATLHPALDSMQELDFVCNQLPIPLHPGAKAYFGEITDQLD